MSEEEVTIGGEGTKLDNDEPSPVDLCQLHQKIVADSNAKSLFDANKVITNSVTNSMKYNLFKFNECVRYNGEIQGKYCLMSYKTGTEPLRYAGACYPNSCSDTNLKELSTKNLGDENKLDNQWCYSAGINFSAFDYFAISFFAIWAFIVLISTIYDYIKTAKNEQITKKWLITFSLYTNVKKVFKLGNESSPMNCLYALRALSVIWLIISNRFRAFTSFPMYDESNFSLWKSNFFSAFVNSSDVAYDTFFMVSGFLLASYCLRAFQIKGMNYFHLVFHRYIRYMPLLIFSIIYYASFFKFFVIGPMAFRLNTRVENCQNYWWSTLFLVENYATPNIMCLYDGWYFSIDFQYFIVLPILIFFFFKWRKFGSILLYTILIAVYASVITLLIIYDTPYDIINRISTLPLQSHFRCAPWIISVFLASFCLKENVSMKKTTRSLCWIGTYAIFIAHVVYIYLLQNKEFGADSVIAGAIFAGVHRLLWSIAIAWIIFACVKLETDGLISYILNSKNWKPLGKLSLSLLIIHPLYQMSTAYSMKTANDFNSWSTFHSSLADIVITSFLSILSYASIEIPFVLIEQGFHQKTNENEMESAIEQQAV